MRTLIRPASTAVIAVALALCKLIYPLQSAGGYPAGCSALAAAGLSEQLPAITSLAWLTESGDGFTPSAAVEVRLSQTTVVVEVDTSGTVDVAAERRRLEKDLAAAQKEMASTTAKLGNDAFLAKAPAEVVDKIRGRQQVATEEVDRITARLAGLK